MVVVMVVMVMMADIRVVKVIVVLYLGAVHKLCQRPKGGGSWKMLTLADKEGGDVREMLTFSERGEEWGLNDYDITDKKLKWAVI